MQCTLGPQIKFNHLGVKISCLYSTNPLISTHISVFTKPMNENHAAGSSFGEQYANLRYLITVLFSVIPLTGGVLNVTGYVSLFCPVSFIFDRPLQHE